MSEHSLVSDEVALESASAGNLVVGHDGSGSADNALLETLKLADQLQIPVSVVRAWSFQTAPRASDWTFGYAPTLDEMQQAATAEPGKR